MYLTNPHETQHWNKVKPFPSHLETYWVTSHENAAMRIPTFLDARNNGSVFSLTECHNDA